MQAKNRLLDDEFWELEMMQSNAEWSINPLIRQGIKSLCDLNRPKEEITIVAGEMHRFVLSESSRLSSIMSLLDHIPVQSAAGTVILQWGLQVELNLRGFNRNITKMLDSTDFGTTLLSNVTEGLRLLCAC
jgi:hypothetical protein